MGSVIGLVDDAGAVGTVHYDGFGNERVVSGSIAAVADEGDFRFQGMWLDGDSGLYYVRVRVYEAQSGRFLSRDPAEGVRTGADTYWTYAFAADNPGVFVDPTGRTSVASLSVGNVISRILAAAAFGSLRAAFSGLRAYQCTGDGDAYLRHILLGTLLGAIGGVFESIVAGAGLAVGAGAGAVVIASQVVQIATSRVLQVALSNRPTPATFAFIAWDVVSAALVASGFPDSEIGRIAGPFLRQLFATISGSTFTQYARGQATDCSEFATGSR